MIQLRSLVLVVIVLGLACPISAAQAQGGASQAVYVTAPIGTRLLVKVDEKLSSKDVKEGDRFSTTLEANAVVGGKTVALAGSKVFGVVLEVQKARRIRKQAKLRLTLKDLSANGQLESIVTDDYAIEGDKPHTLRKVVAGAAVGGIVDGEKGAATGAAVGGVAAVITGAGDIEVKQGALLEFELTVPASLMVVEP